MKKWVFAIGAVILFSSCINLLGSSATPVGEEIQPGIAYYANGQMMYKGQYSHGYRHGEWVEWNGEGDTVSILNYNYGELNGPFKIWKLDRKYEDISESDYAKDYGKVIQVVGNYTNGVLDGRYDVFYHSKSIKTTGFYNKGRLDGKWVEIAPSGDTLSVINYSLGQKKGPFVVWNYLGITLNGTNTKMSEKIKHQGIFKFDKLEGNYVESYLNGTVYCSGGYMEGLREGDWTWYYPSGIIKETATFRLGELVKSNNYNKRGY